MSYEEYWNRIYHAEDKLNSLFDLYWSEYSSWNSWQFWVVFILWVGPLILLFFTVERSRIFELFCFGYSVHLLWTYVDVPLERYGYFVHQYFIHPIFPYSLNMTASVLPVSFLLLYQYCTNKKKNFVMYTVILSALFSFVFAPLEKVIGLVDIQRGMNYFYVFLVDLGVVFISYFFTRMLKKVQQKS